MTMSMSTGHGPAAGPKKMFKVLCPIEKKDGKGGTYWIRVGSAFPNRDQSINLYLDVLPQNGRLQLRELDEEDLRERSGRRGGDRDRDLPAVKPANDEQLPF
jgi:hypothetical protein